MKHELRTKLKWFDISQGWLNRDAFLIIVRGAGFWRFQNPHHAVSEFFGEFRDLHPLCDHDLAG